MPNPIGGYFEGPFFKNLDRTALKWHQDVETRIRAAINQLGVLQGIIDAQAKIAGRTEGIGTTVQHVDSVGIIKAPGVDFSRAYVNKTIDHVDDGATYVRTIPNEKTGAGRAFNALDSNSRLESTRRLTMNNASYTPATGVSPVSAATGGAPNTATISIAAHSEQFPFGPVPYSAGSITPLNDSTAYYVYASDPTFAGGAVTYFATTTNPDVTAQEGIIYFGKVTTPAFGGGGTGGGGGGGGPCFSGNTRLVTPAGNLAIADIRVGDKVLALNGWRTVLGTFEHDYDGILCAMGEDEFVTPGHRILHPQRDLWLRAEDFFPRAGSAFSGKVYNVHCDGNSADDGEHCYRLAAGLFAHNVIKI